MIDLRLIVLTVILVVIFFCTINTGIGWVFGLASLILGSICTGQLYFALTD